MVAAPSPTTAQRHASAAAHDRHQLERGTLLGERKVLLQARLTATLVDLKRLFVIDSFANRPAPQLPNPTRVQTATDRSQANRP